jgi:hypothetical protein
VSTSALEISNGDLQKQDACFCEWAEVGAPRMRNFCPRRGVAERLSGGGNMESDYRTIAMTRGRRNAYVKTEVSK